jgi:hypothetical protein
MYFDVGIVFGVSMEYAVFQSVVEGSDVLPEFGRDSCCVETYEEYFSVDGRES